MSGTTGTAGSVTGKGRLARALTLAVIVASGLLVGLGVFTLVYARGYSYLLDDPQACVNCHVMRDNYNAWTVASHRAVSCNGCHTPHDPIGKWVVKAEHGVNHSYVFTFGDPQVIRIKPTSLAVVERNCIDCHERMVSTIFTSGAYQEDTSVLTRMASSMGFSEETGARCTVCHRAVGHAF